MNAIDQLIDSIVIPVFLEEVICLLGKAKDKCKKGDLIAIDIPPLINVDFDEVERAKANAFFHSISFHLLPKLSADFLIFTRL
jgi:hypothetical protein